MVSAKVKVKVKACAYEAEAIESRPRSRPWPQCNGLDVISTGLDLDLDPMASAS